MHHFMARLLQAPFELAIALALLLGAGEGAAWAQTTTRDELARGEYLVQFGGCIRLPHARILFW